MKRIQHVVLAATVVTGCVVGCGGPTDAQMLLTRASYDMQCPEAKLSVTELNTQTRGVRGCAKQATYVYTPSGWVMNSADKK